MEGGLHMRKFNLSIAFVLLVAIALGTYSISQAQSDSADAEVTINSQAVFISLTTTFVGSDVTATDVENGFTPFTPATLNVDATAAYQLGADTSTSGNTSAPVGAAFTSTNSEDSACQVDIDNDSTFENGDAVTPLTGQAITTGTGGTDHDIDLQIDWTQYSNAPSGAYTCSVRVTVTEE